MDNIHRGFVVPSNCSSSAVRTKKAIAAESSISERSSEFVIPAWALD